MTDPYQVLGITRDASDEEIKKAYRALSRQYHPDANINNPNKAYAEEKFKQVQAAYQQILKEKEQGSDPYGFHGQYQGDFGSGFYGTGYHQNNTSEEDMHMRAAVNYINSRHYREALNVLSGISERSAQWYYLSAIANAGLGNNVQAMEYAKTAASLEPSNGQYQRLVQQLEYGGNWYQSQQSYYGQPVNLGNNMCLKLCIANLMCNICCGGGGMCYGTYPGGGC